MKKISTYHHFVCHLAGLGASVSAGYFRQRILDGGNPKMHLTIPKTNKKVADTVLTKIKSSYPDHQVIDDFSFKAKNLFASRPTWIIDYLDGEKNFEAGFPYFGCSVAFYEGGQCQTAAVSDGLHQETFSFARGLGSFLNGRRLKTAISGDPRQTILSVSWPFQVSSRDLHGLNTLLYEHTTPIFRQQRRAGSIALDLSYIAGARFGGLYAFDPALVDLAAGLPIAQGAGCRAINFDGETFAFGDKTLIVASQPVLDILWPHINLIFQQQNLERTSLTHPYRIDFVPMEFLGAGRNKGRLGLGQAPGQKYQGKLYRQIRDLSLDLKLIRETYRIDVIVSLLEDKEYQKLALTDFFEKARAMSLEVLRLPIKDMNVPESQAAVLELVQKINQRINHGQNVLIHCAGGVGRTGIIASSLLIYRRGISADEAIAIIQDSRIGALQSKNQHDFLRDFALWLRRKK